MKQLLEKMLNAEMDEHLGYKKHENNKRQNSRNGYFEKTVKGLFGSSNLKSLSKVIYLAIQNQTKKWNMPIRNWGIIYNQLSILFELD